MLTYVIRRLLYSIVVLIAASFIIFTFVSYSNDPVAFLRMQPTASEQTIQNIPEGKPRDEPVPVQYLYWAKDALFNQFGTTTIGDRPILPDLTRVMGHTLQLVIAAELLAILLAVAIGVYSALRQYSAFDYSATTFSFLGLATPVFWLGLMLQVLIVYILDWTGHQIFPIANLSDV